MVYVQNRIKLGMVLLQYFTMRNWIFRSGKFIALAATVPDSDKEDFYTTNTRYDIDTYMKDAILGARVFCMKESLENLPRARRQMKM